MMTGEDRRFHVFLFFVGLLLVAKATEGTTVPECLVPCSDAEIATASPASCADAGGGYKKQRSDCSGKVAPFQPAPFCFPPSERVASTNETIVLEYNGWFSQRAITDAAAIFLQEKLGYTVERLHVSAASPPYGSYYRNAMEIVDANLELWPAGKETGFNEWVVEKKLAEVGGSVGVVGQSGLYVTVLGSHEHLGDIYWDYWREYRRSTTTKVFSNNTIPYNFEPRKIYKQSNASQYHETWTCTEPFCSNGQYFPPQCTVGADGLSDCHDYYKPFPGYDLAWDESLVTHSGFKLTTVYLGAHFNDVILDHFQHNKSALFYSWEPHPFNILVKAIRVSFKRNTQRCTNNHVLDPRVSPTDCDFPSQLLQKIFSSTLSTRHPRAHRFLKAFQIDNDEMENLMAKHVSAGGSHTEIAEASCAWIKDTFESKWAPLLQLVDAKVCGNGQFVNSSAPLLTSSGRHPCDVCPAGTFAFGVDSTSCSPCPAGTFSPGGLSSCVQCPDGLVSDIGARQCYACPPGTFQEGLSCVPCRLHTFQPVAGQSACRQCPIGRFTLAEGQESCQECNANAAFDLTLDRCTCLRGYYANVTTFDTVHNESHGVIGIVASSVCLECPEGGTCDGGNAMPYPRPGYFGHRETPWWFTPCYPPSNCIGGKDFQCAPSQSGHLCSDCNLDHFKFGQTLVCSQCPEGKTQRWLLTVGGLVANLLIWTILKRLLSGRFESLYVALTIIQMLGVVGRFRLNWSDNLKRIFNRLSIANFEIDFIGPQCLFEWKTQETILLALLMPVIIIFWYSAQYFVGCVWLHAYNCLRRGKKSSMRSARASQTPSPSATVSYRGDDGGGRKKVNSWLKRLVVSHLVRTFPQNDSGLATLRDHSIESVTIMCNIMYHTLVLRTFDSFWCDVGQDGIRYLHSAPSVICGSDEHKRLLATASTIGVLSCVSIPALFIGALMYGRKHSLMRNPWFLHKFKSLYQRFVTDCWWWELTNLLRRASLVTILFSGSDHPSLQIISTIHIMTFTIAIQFFAMPYIRRDVNWLDGAGMFAVMAMTLVGLVADSNLSIDNYGIFIIVAILVWTLLVMLRNFVGTTMTANALDFLQTKGLMATDDIGSDGHHNNYGYGGGTLRQGNSKDGTIAKNVCVAQYISGTLHRTQCEPIPLPATPVKNKIQTDSHDNSGARNQNVNLTMPTFDDSDQKRQPTLHLAIRPSLLNNWICSLPSRNDLALYDLVNRSTVSYTGPESKVSENSHHMCAQFQRLVGFALPQLTGYLLQASREQYDAANRFLRDFEMFMLDKDEQNHNFHHAFFDYKRPAINSYLLQAPHQCREAMVSLLIKMKNAQAASNHQMRLWISEMDDAAGHGAGVHTGPAYPHEFMARPRPGINPFQVAAMQSFARFTSHGERLAKKMMELQYRLGLHDALTQFERSHDEPDEPDGSNQVFTQAPQVAHVQQSDNSIGVAIDDRAGVASRTSGENHGADDSTNIIGDDRLRVQAHRPTPIIMQEPSTMDDDIATLRNHTSLEYNLDQDGQDTSGGRGDGDDDSDDDSSDDSDEHQGDSGVVKGADMVSVVAPSRRNIEMFRTPPVAATTTSAAPPFSAFGDPTTTMHVATHPSVSEASPVFEIPDPYAIRGQSSLWQPTPVPPLLP